MTNSSPAPDGPVTVRLVGGPPDWHGQTLSYERHEIENAEFEDLGGVYIVDGAHIPPRRRDEDEAPRAHYAPEPGDRYTWHFQGWVPHSPADPPPSWYLPTHGSTS